MTSISLRGIPVREVIAFSAVKELALVRSDGGSDDDYNAYNYMVLTARAKPHARLQIPAVIHADGTARLQIVPEETDSDDEQGSRLQ